MMATSPPNELDAARLRAEAARKEVAGTIDEIFDRLKPWNAASHALTKARAGNVNWLSLGLSAYRFRGTVTSLLGLLTAVKAKKKGEEQARKELSVSDPDHDENKLEGVYAMAGNLKETADHAREKIRSAADTAAEKALHLKDVSAAKAADVYERSREKSRTIGTRLAESARENPVATVIGGVALGVLIGALLPRPRSETDKFGQYRDKVSNNARQALQAVSDRLDELGINRENVRDTASKVKDAVREAGTHASETAREILSRDKAHH